ncbi:MAG: hypothetical protein H0V51_20110 [Chloroflexi bacterium]|nr:hypothetical protein [Chloroflexota bacterium]
MLAGAAAGLAVGTKGTALLAVPGLVVGLVALLARRRDRRVLAGAAFGGVAAFLLGSYIYVQNWLLYGALSPAAFKLETAVGEVTPQGFAANLARTLYRFAFADLHGPLLNPAARPLREPIEGTLAALGERIFAILGIPLVVGDLDIPWWVEFTFIPPPSLVYFSGVGPIGGLILVFALAALVWPGRIRPERRLLGFAAVSYLVLMAATLRWNPFAGGRFLITACAVAAPLLGAIMERRGSERALALVVALWVGLSGLYVATFNDDKPVPWLIGRERPGLVSPRYPNRQPLFRQIEQELGPTSTVGVYDNYDALPYRKDQWEYPFFGRRFTRTVLPLVRPNYAERMGIGRPPPWTNEGLASAYPPTYVAVHGWSANPNRRLELLHPDCFELPLPTAPSWPWELWRCRDDDPRSVLENGDLRAWPSGWAVDVAGDGRLDVTAVEPVAGGEPFRLRLDYRAGDADDVGGIVQEVPVDTLRGRVLVVDARVRADRVGAAVLVVDDGEDASEVASESTAGETLRIEHTVHPRALGLWVRLDASGAGEDAVVLARTILAIPRQQ